METRTPSSPTLGRRARRIGLIAAGSLFLALGMVGVVIPVLPTTPFLLLAAICYGRSSERSYRWLVTNRLFGRYLDDYLHGRGISWRVKVPALILLWGVITLSAVLFVPQWWVRAVMFAVAVGVTVHILMLKGRSDRRTLES
jgi:uncharacterized membrane protein YbaN (DUF454 family)